MTRHSARGIGEPQSVLLIGAYERENFGDLLFLILTEHYLGSRPSLAAAPFESDMSALLGREIQAFGEVLSREMFDVVWTVGGEVGGIGVNTAFEVSASPPDYQRYVDADPRDRRRLVLEHMHCPRLTSPYVPDLRLFPMASGARQVLNSVGLGGMQHLSGSERLPLLRTLACAAEVSVRDATSSRVLRRFGIPHVLAPDLVHTLALVRPVPPQTTAPVLVQASAGYLSRVGVENFAAALAGSRALARHEIRLFAAGTARFHDDVEVYGNVVEQVLHRSPGRNISICTARGPLDKADQIATSRLWIGTSLHGRIVSASYDRPRIGLADAKVTSYAGTWDATMPFDVPLEQLDSAVEEALSPALLAESLPMSGELRRLADENIRTLVRTVDFAPRDSRAKRTARSVRVILPFTNDYLQRRVARPHRHKQ